MRWFPPDPLAGRELTTRLGAVGPHPSDFGFKSWRVADRPIVLMEGEIMLVLSRKPGERIRIGDDVVLTIVRIGPNTVRVGIDAPRDTDIVREELLGDTQEAVTE